MSRNVSVFQGAHPEWWAKTLIVEHYNRASVLLGLAAVDRSYLPEFKSAVAALYSFIRSKMWRYKNRLGLKKETLERYDKLLHDRKVILRASYSEIVEWFLDIQNAVETLGYLKFEKGEVVPHNLVVEDRGGG